MNAKAQDLHFSQFYHAPLNLNPALAGVHYGDFGFVANYRSQWESIGVDYLTFSGTLERKFYVENLQNSYFAGGLLFNFDQAGTSKLSRTNIGVSGSYSTQLSPILFLTGGAHIGINQRAFRTQDLTFDNMFNGEQFDPNEGRESFDKTNTLSIDLGAGVNFHLQPANAHPVNKRSKLDVGVSVFHVNRPNEAFNLNEDIRLERRFSSYVIGTLMLAENFDVLVRGTAQFQGAFQQNVIGGAGKIHLSKKPSRELAVALGAAYRFNTVGDAIIPHIDFQIRQWLLGLSYDINVSELQMASVRQGGPEVALRYLFTNIKPAAKTKVCPII
jgi:type IX secretion system PorP/SprF family membrane protein